MVENDDVKRQRAHEGLSGGAGGAGTGESDISGEQSVSNGAAIIGSGAVE